MVTTQNVTPCQAWVLAARPKTLPAAMAPVITGTALAYADGDLAPFAALAALVGALLIQIGTNLANDYFDCVKGVDTAERKGPLRVAHSGLIPLPHLRLGIGLTFVTATAVGTYLVVRGGWPVVLIGLASIAAALAYAGGPYPLGSHGLGDLLVFLFFGLVAVGGTYYVQALTITPIALIAAIPVGSLTTAILVVNNLRDIETDQQAGKRTLAVMIGPQATRLEYALLLLIAYGIPLWMWLFTHNSPWILLPFLSAPLAWRLMREMWQETGSRLNETLAQTAKLDLLFSGLFALGVVLG
ncbi:MAG: 1,4-dihydroxy-2-naphthoate polyprenyltransferase [Nitrospinota bacterium]|nr:MAG: 1,4-dihydroxy-2-naphthoate polyprenyltransferase [Nitrospinota bacterium]